MLALVIERSRAFLLMPNNFFGIRNHVAPHLSSSSRQLINISFDEGKNNDDEDEKDEEDDEEDDEPDPYQETALSEFSDEPGTASSPGSLVLSDASGSPTTALDWGGALGKLRERMEDIETGKSQDPSHALFRLMSSQSPNQAIGKFVSSASPQVVQAMSGAVSSLLGGLSNPMSGVETIVKASGDKVASLCFQLQMTGYLFRNAEYVLALKDLMNLEGTATLDDYKEAFGRLDGNGSGYIEVSEIESLLNDVYDGKTPDFEIQAFLEFFDKNKDGKISWEEFQRGLMGMAEGKQSEQKSKQLFNNLLLPGSEEDDEVEDIEPHLSGKLEIELEDGKVVQVDAQEYMETLKAEAKSLKEALQREKGIKPQNGTSGVMPPVAGPTNDELGGIANYIASRQGDVKSLTEGISPEIVKTMKMLVDYVLEGGDSRKARKKVKPEEMEMEIPGTALQQLALWQLVLGYKLREAEAKGDYLKLLE